jgi:hypothetical protein
MRSSMDAPVPPFVARFAVTPHDPAAIETSAARFVVTLDMELDDPAGPALLDNPLVQEAWRAVESNASSPASTLRFEAGRVRLRAMVAAWDRRRMELLLAVMSALSSARTRPIA